MTRLLAELLGAREPLFSRSVQQLEKLSGHPNADIRLSGNIEQGMREKLRELGLDMHDTPGRELYGALGERLKADEKRFVDALGAYAPESDDIIAQIAAAIKPHIEPRRCYALKTVAAKRILKANLPKKTMKTLGYRSLDSMLKHESAATLYAAAALVESDSWHKRLLGSYTKLQAVDFEQRELTIEHPSSMRWKELAETVVAVRKHNVLSFKELGAVVILPLPAEQPPLAALTTTVLALRAINEIRASGTFLKLHQMQSNFGRYVQDIIMGIPMLPAEALDEPVSWHSLHQYFSRYSASVRSDIFEPVVSMGELVWTNIEQVIARIAPALEFWERTAHLALLDHGQFGLVPVSCNLTDALLSHCNNLPFDSRLAQHFQESLRSELLLNYLSHDKLEQTFFAGVEKRLAPEMAMI